MRRVLACLALSLAAAHAAAGDVITVPTDIPTLSLALNPAVSGLQPGDTIVLTDGAVYFDPYTVTTPDITIRAAEGHAIEINPFGVGSAFTVDIGAGSLTLEGLTIRNGSNEPSNGRGGGIFAVSAGALVITDCRFIDNSASRGGAIYATDCDVTLTDCDFTDNTALVFGGAVRTGGASDVRITRTAFSGNRALNGNGGAIDHAGDGSTLDIVDSVFTNNTCTAAGGAIFAALAAAVTVDNVEFFDNVALGNASQDTGGLFISGTPSVLVRDCAFERNFSAGSGGALRFSGSAGDVVSSRFTDNAASSAGALQVVGAGAYARVYNSVFEGNSARRAGTDSANGGGAATVNSAGARLDIYNSLLIGNTGVTGGAITAFDAGVLNVFNCTFVANDADAIGGAIRRAATTASVIVNNSIFTGNIPTASQVAIGGSGTDEVNFSIVEGGYTAVGTGNFDADPMFVDASNGDYSLLPGSPAIDAGSSVRYQGGPLSDLAGNVRGVDDPDTADAGEAIFGAVIDVGAYEFQVGGGGPLCEGDATGDGQINFADLNAVLSVFGTACD